MFYEVPLSRINEMAGVSAQAFVSNNDPIGNFIFEAEPKHLEFKKRFFSFLVTSCSPQAIRHAISDNLEAISIWFPPGMDHSQDSQEDPFNPQEFKDPSTIQKLQAVNEVITALTADLGQEPQWYMHLVAVPPQFRNQKYASQLIRPMLERAKQEGLACSLITQSMENVLKYQHFGFKVIKEMPVPNSKEKFYSMRKI